MVTNKRCGVLFLCLCVFVGGTLGMSWIQKLSKTTLVSMLKDVGEAVRGNETVSQLRVRVRTLVRKGCATLGANGSAGGGDDCPRIVGRDGWAARPPLSVEYLIVPVKNVIIQHSFTLKCTSLTLCSSSVSLLQTFYMDERHEKDIAESFLIGGDGNVYEGTGWHRVGNHTKGYNYESIGVSMIGDFRDMLPPARQMDALRKLLQCGVVLGELDPDYRLLARRQLSREEIAGVGVALFLELQTWPHWAGQPEPAAR